MPFKKMTGFIRPVDYFYHTGAIADDAALVAYIEQNVYPYTIRGKTSGNEVGPFSTTVNVTITSSGGTVMPGGPVQ